MRAGLIRIGGENQGRSLISSSVFLPPGFLIASLFLFSVDIGSVLELIGSACGSAGRHHCESNVSAAAAHISSTFRSGSASAAAVSTAHSGANILPSILAFQRQDGCGPSQQGTFEGLPRQGKGAGQRYSDDGMGAKE